MSLSNVETGTIASAAHGIAGAVHGIVPASEYGAGSPNIRPPGGIIGVHEALVPVGRSTETEATVGFELTWTWFWIILAAILVVGEIFTAGFFMLPFGIGAAMAALAAGFGLGAGVQWTVFVVVSVAALLMVKRFADRVTEGAGQGIASDRVIGKVGMVLEEVQAHGFTGRVRLGSEEWRAASEGEESIAVGTAVEVLSIDGTHLVVRPRRPSAD